MPEISTFDFARLAALKQYADLERELILVMKYAINSEYEGASVVFYGISNTRARYAIIGRQLARRDEGKFLKAWEWIERKLGACDTDRNQLVHWSEDKTISIHMTQTQPFEIASIESRPKLRHPATSSTSAAEHYEADIWKKRDSMLVMLHIVNRFALSLTEPLIWPWSDVFQKPLGNLKPEGLLQLLNDKGHPTALPPYPEKLLSPRRRPEVDERRPDIEVSP